MYFYHMSDTNFGSPLYGDVLAMTVPLKMRTSLLNHVALERNIRFRVRLLDRQKCDIYNKLKVSENTFSGKLGWKTKMKIGRKLNLLFIPSLHQGFITLKTLKKPKQKCAFICHISVEVTPFL